MDNDSNYLFRLAAGHLREQAINLHIARYREVGFIRKDEKDPYQANSIYFTAESRITGEVVGVTRLIIGKLEKLPTMANFLIYDLERARLEQLEPYRYAELSAFTRMPAHDVGIGLLKTAYQYSDQTGMTHWVCCVDQRVFHYLNRVFKFPFQVIGESKVYMGSVTVPCVLNLQSVIATVRIERPALYTYLTDCQTRYMEASQ